MTLLASHVGENGCSTGNAEWAMKEVQCELASEPTSKAAHAARVHLPPIPNLMRTQIEQVAGCKQRRNPWPLSLRLRTEPVGCKRPDTRSGQHCYRCATDSDAPLTQLPAVVRQCGMGSLVVRDQAPGGQQTLSYRAGHTRTEGACGLHAKGPRAAHHLLAAHHGGGRSSPTCTSHASALCSWRIARTVDR